MSWTPRERFRAVMAGELADRSPVTAWRHHRESEYPGGPLAQWTADFARRWRWDWVKVNPRATYYAEVWGNQYRTGDYEVRDIPRQTGVAVTSVDDLAAIDVRSDSPVLAEQVRMVATVHELVPELPVVQTIFSPLSTLIQTAGLSYYAGRPTFGVNGRLELTQLLTTDPALAHRALRAITDTWLAYVGQLRDAGVEGLFYALTGTQNPQITSADTFAEFSEPYDLAILEASSDLARIVHTCGEHARPDLLTTWGAAVSWDHFAHGNPELGELDVGVVAGGVDHRAFGDVSTVAEEARAAAELGGRRPLLVTPTCSVLSTDAQDASLTALSDLHGPGAP